MNLEEKLLHLKAWYQKKKELILHYFSLPFEKKNKPFVSKGDIYLADLGANIGGEIDKTRPVVVFQSKSRRTIYLQTAFVFPITSSISPYHHKIYFEESDENSKCRKGCVVVSQGRCISKMRLKKYWGELSSDNIKKVEHGFLRFLGIKNSPPR